MRSFNSLLITADRLGISEVTDCTAYINTDRLSEAGDDACDYIFGDDA